MDYALAGISVAAGWVAHAYVWPTLKLWVNGAEAEATALKARADALLARIKRL